MVSLTINGVVREVDADPDTPLLWVIRCPSSDDSRLMAGF